MADDASNLLHFPARVRPLLSVIEQSPAGRHGYAAPDRDEPNWTFTVDLSHGCVWWRLSDGHEVQLRHEPQFDALLTLCIEAGFKRAFNACGDAQLALSAVPASDVVRAMFRACPEVTETEPPPSAA